MSRPSFQPIGAYLQVGKLFCKLIKSLYLVYKDIVSWKQIYTKNPNHLSQSTTESNWRDLGGPQYVFFFSKIMSIYPRLW